MSICLGHCRKILAGDTSSQTVQHFAFSQGLSDRLNSGTSDSCIKFRVVWWSLCSLGISSRMMMIAFITFKSSLVPLFEGLWSSNSWEFELSGFRRNRTDDLGIDSHSNLGQSRLCAHYSTLKVVANSFIYVWNKACSCSWYIFDTFIHIFVYVYKLHMCMYMLGGRMRSWTNCFFL